MGVLSDLIIGTEADLAGVPAGDAPINVLPGLDVKGIDITKLATLHDLVTGREFDPALEAFPLVSGQESEDGPWVFRCPDDLVASLAALDEPSLTTLAARWATTDEFRMDHWEAAAVTDCLRSISALAKSAMQEGKPIHLWTSL